MQNRHPGYMILSMLARLERWLDLGIWQRRQDRRTVKLTTADLYARFRRVWYRKLAS